MIKQFKLQTILHLSAILDLLDSEANELEKSFFFKRLLSNEITGRSIVTGNV